MNVQEPLPQNKASLTSIIPRMFVNRLSLRQRLLLILLFAVVMRVIVVFIVGVPDDSTAHEFGDIATNLATDRGFSYRWYEDLAPIPTAYMPPAYVYLLSGTFIAAGVGSTAAYSLLVAIQIAISVFAVWIVYAIAKEFFGRGPALTAAAVLALYPPHIYTPTLVSSVTLATTLVLAFAYAAIKARNSKGFMWPLILGAILGVSALTRSEMAPLILIVPLVFLYVKRENVSRSVLILLAALVVVIPWQVRNFTVFDEVVPLTTSSGFNLWRAHNELSSTDGLPTAIDQFVQLDEEMMQTFRQYYNEGTEYELARDKLFRRTALDNIKSYPLDTVIRFAKRVGVYFSFNPNNASPLIMLYFAAFLFLLVAAVGSTFQKSISTGSAITLWFIAGYMTVWPVVFFVLPRYRVTIEPLLIVIAAPTVYKLCAIIARRMGWLSSYPVRADS